VLGANDGIVSTASLIIGVAAAQIVHADIMLAGVAGLVAGAMSMAAVEYVSVSSQSETEKAGLKLEQRSLDNNIDYEKKELADIYEARGLDSGLAEQVAEQLMAHDALAAHARDELGLTKGVRARPVQAAFYSASTFTAGVALPLLTAWFMPGQLLIPLVAVFSIISLAISGGLAAFVGGASLTAGAVRVTFWGALAMGLTAAVGKLFGVAA